MAVLLIIAIIINSGSNNSRNRTNINNNSSYNNIRNTLSNTVVMKTGRSDTARASMRSRSAAVEKNLSRRQTDNDNETDDSVNSNGKLLNVWLKQTLHILHNKY